MPSLCPICGEPARRSWEPCASCREEALRIVGDSCSLCGIDLAGSDDPCPVCRGRATMLDGVVALGVWGGPLREWLSMLKYGGDWRLAAWPAQMAAASIRNRWPEAVVVPVPPRSGRTFRNGPDAVTLVSRELRRLGIPVEKPLRRIGRRSQKSLSREDRLSGRALHFERRRGRRIPKCCVLLDDVSTTGSTLRSCAKALKDSGAAQAYAVVICRD